MNPLRVIFVGRMKTDFFRQAAEHYLRALRRHLPAEEIVVKDGRGGDAARRVAEEGRNVLARLTSRDRLVALHVRGRMFASAELAATLRAFIDDPGRAPAFVIGGAHGLSEEVAGRADLLLSLGPGTLPHELARVVLLEQLYRAAAILAGSPYHH